MILSPAELKDLRLSLSSTPLQPETLPLLPFMGVPPDEPRFTFVKYWRSRSCLTASLPKSPIRCLNHKASYEWSRHRGSLIIDPINLQTHVVNKTGILSGDIIASYPISTIGQVARIYDVWAGSDTCPASIGLVTSDSTSRILATVRTHDRDLDIDRIELHAMAARLLEIERQKYPGEQRTSGLLIVDALEGWVPGGG